jgi:hypothetical protein
MQRKKLRDCCEFDSFIVCAKPQSLMVFGTVMKELKANIDSNKLVIDSALRKNPGLAYNKVNELARSVGRRYNMELNIHFPDSSKIKEISSYGTENIGIIIDKFRKKFPIPREDIKRKALGMTGCIEVKDAYMYEGKEGVRVSLRSGRIEIQPGAIHLWCNIDSDVITFVDWLMQYVYFNNKN